jgi:hypothetical protein
MRFIDPLFDDGDKVGSGFRIDVKTGFITDAALFGADDWNIFLQNGKKFLLHTFNEFDSGNYVQHFSPQMIDVPPEARQ